MHTYKYVASSIARGDTEHALALHALALHALALHALALHALALHALASNLQKMPRKFRPGPELPEDPIERFEEIRKFKRLLADQFYDYNYRDVYDSIFRSRVDAILENVNFDPEKMTEEEKDKLTEKQKVLSMKIFKIGKEIQETDSTEVKLYIAFFKSVEDFFD